MQLPRLGGHVQALCRRALRRRARLDQKPELLFVLRNVDEQELLAGASGDLSFGQATSGAKLLNDVDVAALFGLDMAETAGVDPPSSKSKAVRNDK